MDQALTFLIITVSLIIIFTVGFQLIIGGSTRQKAARGIDKALSKSQFGQIFILAFLIIATFSVLFFASAAISSYYNKEYELSFWNALGHFFNPGNFNDTGLSKTSIFIINILGMILMTGLLISVLSNLLERRVDNIKNGRVSYKFKDHIVIIGYDRMTISLVKQLHKKYPDSEIIVQTIQNVPEVRHELFSYLTTKIEQKIIIISGNRNSLEDLSKLRLPEAKEVFLLGECGEYEHDSLNIECLKKAHKILCMKPEKSKKAFHVLFENQSTYAVLQQHDIQGLNNNRQIEFIPFNFQEKWAEKVFIDCCYEDVESKIQKGNICYSPLDRVPVQQDSAHTVHLIIVGMSRMGIALGIEATHLCHFPNFIQDPCMKTRVTFIDKNADKEMYFLQGRYQSLFKEITHKFENINSTSKAEVEPTIKKEFTDIEWNFIKGEIENPIIQERIEGFCKEKNTLVTIAICLNNPTAAIAAGMYLRNTVYESDKIKLFDQHRELQKQIEELRIKVADLESKEKQLKENISDEHKSLITAINEELPPLKEKLSDFEEKWNLFNVQVLIKQDTAYSILSMLKESDKYHNVKPFGMLDNCLNVSSKERGDQMAQRVHYVYSYYFDEKTYKQIPTTIPADHVLKEKWDGIPTAEKWSNRYHANMIPVKLRSFSFKELQEAINEGGTPAKIINSGIVETIAQVEHNRWNTEKLLLGFRPATAVEKEEAKSELKKRFIHPDIEKYSLLDEETKDRDRMITQALPLIIKDLTNESI